MALIKLNAINHLFTKISRPFLLNVEKFHTGIALNEDRDDNGPKRWLSYNEVIHPPQAPDEEQRPAVRYTNLSMSPRNLLISFALHSMSVIRELTLNTALGRCGT